MGGFRQILRVSSLILGGVVLVAFFMILPDLMGLLPRPVLHHPVESATVALLAVYSAARLAQAWHGFASRPWHRWLRGCLRLIDAGSRALLDRWLGVGLGLLAGYWVVTWLPHYLYWPWARDVDTFAVIAQAWEAGELPYRDIHGYNFPGHTYIHLILGKVFGWGHPALFRAADAASLFVLLTVLLGWSLRCFGSRLPGLASSLGILGLYLSLHADRVAQRDWHAALGAALALLVIQGWPGRMGRWVSAALAAAAFTIRPHVVLFLPALVMAAMTRHAPRRGSEVEAEGQATASFRSGIPAALEWCLAFGILCVLAFSPLVAAGILDDLLRGLRTAAYGGPYSKATPEKSATILLEQLRDPLNFGAILLLAALAVRLPSPGMSRLAREWLLAVVGALAYRPLHPVDHYYVRLPLALVSAIAWAIPVAWAYLATSACAPRKVPAFFGVVAILLAAYEISPNYPEFCSMEASIESARSFLRGGWPGLPPGGFISYSAMRQPYYTWEGYCRLLDHLRDTTGDGTIVANVLLQPPFPPVNGPVGRRSPFQYESGIAWMLLVDEDLDDVFSRELEKSGPDSVVVWSPIEEGSQPRMRLRRLTEAIRRLYAPEARFGHVEVWRRKAGIQALGWSG